LVHTDVVTQQFADQGCSLLLLLCRASVDVFANITVQTLKKNPFLSPENTCLSNVSPFAAVSQLR